MGVTIHYHGGLDDPAQLNAALAMLRVECQQRGWPYRAHDFSARGTFETYSVRSVPSDLPVWMMVWWRQTTWNWTRAGAA